MADRLFRREALEARQRAPLGRVLLRLPLSTRLLVAGAVATGAILLLILTNGSYVRRTRVLGQLMPRAGVSVAHAPVSGVLSTLVAREGVRVAPGALLAIIRVPRPRSAGGDSVDALRANLARRDQQLAASRVQARARGDAHRRGLLAQLQQGSAERAAVQAEVATRQAQLQLAQATLEQWRELERQNFVSRLQLRQQESAVLAQAAELQALQRQAIAAQRSLAQLRQSLADLPSEVAGELDAIEREATALARERIELDAAHESVVTAQVAGTVAAITASPGDTVQAGQALLQVLPEASPLQAELWLPSRAVGFVRPGDVVQLRYQAYPYPKFGHHPGRVREVDRSALDASQVRPALRGAGAAEPFYRVTVELTNQFVAAYGRAEPLKPGMLVDADILGERRSLVEWLFEPLFALRSSLDRP